MRAEGQSSHVHISRMRKKEGLRPSRVLDGIADLCFMLSASYSYGCEGCGVCVECSHRRQLRCCSGCRSPCPLAWDRSVREEA